MLRGRTFPVAKTLSVGQSDAAPDDHYMK